MDPKESFFFGDTISIVDISLVPWFQRYACSRSVVVVVVVVVIVALTLFYFFLVVSVEVVLT